jgi:hypothetical protein
MQIQIKWELPLSSYVKVNYDAAFYPELNNGTYGYVIRDEEGSL